MFSNWRCLHETGSVVLFAVLVRWMVSVNSYSGKGKPPMHGDFEAQRHWMEITYHLPVKDWYFNSTTNDLNYWGLDYPPLTAYHSWICGAVSHILNPEWIALESSRGHESEAHKIFMRATVLVADILVYIPGLCAIFYERRTSSKGFPYVMKICSEILVAMLAPGIILIDHGHFQYNCISLGLAAWAVYAIVKKQDITAAVLFSLSLNYKQMSLYYALPFFFYLLGTCWSQGFSKGFQKLVFLAVAVIGTFAVCWAPFLTDLRTAGQVLHRLFPFARGIFEDKVANIWCALNVVLKLKNWEVSKLAAISAFVTLVSCGLSCVDVFRRPNELRFRYSLLNCSLIFFLCSFQVHEKSILLPALPATLLLLEEPLACVWFLSAAAFSMFPLLLKDGLALPCYALVVLFLVSARAFLDWKPESAEGDESTEFQFDLVSFLMTLSLIGFVGLSLACQFAPVFPRYPDLWPLLLSVYSCGHFVLFTVYFHFRQLNIDVNSVDVRKSLSVTKKVQ